MRAIPYSLKSKLKLFFKAQNFAMATQDVGPNNVFLNWNKLSKVVTEHRTVTMLCAFQESKTTKTTKQTDRLESKFYPTKHLLRSTSFRRRTRSSSVPRLEDW